jgi:ATP-dependent protease ClpP protease subunit
MKMKRYLTQIYVDHNSAGKTYDELATDMERDYFMNSHESLVYGLADEVINKR